MSRQMAMGRHACEEELRRRGYPDTLAAIAVDRAGLEGHYDLARHVVTLTGDAEYMITPLPWPEGGPKIGAAVPAYSPVRGIPEIIELVDAWLDGAVAAEYGEQPLAQDWARAGKIGEELGEAQEELDGWRFAAHQARLSAISVPAGRAVQALIAVTGQNPRKGVHGTREALLSELADVACTALFAIQHFTKDADATWAVFTESLGKARSRVPADSPFPPESGMSRQDAIDNGIIG